MSAQARIPAAQEQTASFTPAGGSAKQLSVRALAALEQSHVRWALLRGASEFGSPGGDVDILVAPSDQSRIEEALAPLGYGRLRSPGRGSHRFYVGYDEREDRWIKLDVVTDLAFGRYQELRLEGALGCLERRRREGDLFVLAADDAFWTLLLHCLLDRGAFSDAHRRSLVGLADKSSATGPLALALERALPQGWRSETLLALSKAEDWTALERVAPAIHAAWARRRPFAIRTRALWHATLRRSGRVPLICRPGPTIRVRSADGALGAEIADRWFLSHRRVRTGESWPSWAPALVAARWHAARGRLVILEFPKSGCPTRSLDRLFGASDLRSIVDSRSPINRLPAAIAQLWSRYLGRPGA